MGTTDPNAPQLPSANSGSALGWFAGWITILLLIALLARTNWGKPIVYYMTWLAVVILILTHADDLAALISGKAFQ